MCYIEDLLKTGRPAPQPEHKFTIIFSDSRPVLIDLKQLERDAKDYANNGNEKAEE